MYILGITKIEPPLETDQQTDEAIDILSAILQKLPHTLPEGMIKIWKQIAHICDLPYDFEETEDGEEDKQSRDKPQESEPPPMNTSGKSGSTLPSR